jgi:hypothetical protein
MKLTAIQRFFCHLTIFTLLVSGGTWLIFNFFIDHNSSWRFLSFWSLRLHGAASYGFLIIFGMLLSTHISFNWQVKKNRRKSGIILTAFLVILILSGYLLYYASDDSFRNLISYLHWLLGIVSGAIFILHFSIKLPKKSGINN